jgi:hypothetical protein
MLGPSWDHIGTPLTHLERFWGFVAPILAERGLLYERSEGLTYLDF